MKRKSRPIKNIVLSYFIFGILWILFSDTLAGYMINDLNYYQSFQSIKGIIFIAVTGIFLYFLLKTNLKEITEKEQELYQQAYFDNLTSLPNKRSLYQDLSSKIEHSQNNRVQFSFAIFYLDLSNIDNLTEIRGYTQGSDLIKKIAKILKNDICNDQDCKLYSYNYNKFILVYNNPGKNIVYQEEANKITDIINNLWNRGEIDYYIDLKIGVSTYPDSGRDVETLISAAQLAASKCDTENKEFQIYNHYMFLDKLELENLKRDLRTAIKKEEFELYYQPKLRCSDHKICGLEALIRWQHPDRGMVSPYKFIKLAEETGLIIEIGDWVLEQAFKQLLKWQQKYEDQISLSVNLSPLELYDEHKIKKIKKLQQQYQINKDLLEFEITENVLLDNRGDPLQILKQLKRLGFSIALDDFGIGYSSFSYLSRLPIDTLKIDKSFIDQLNDQKNMILIDSIINLSHKMKLEVIAEGIETADQLKTMSDLNCDQIQGYYFYRPLPLSELKVILAEEFKTTETS
ncbi:diguanylate cyclase (GGDEF)-like protein [Halanaerobium saccharolyticum]|uniref:Diguanylate cyclase (GGDEF)-like protein n=1 Tax=Halanaerobium saccharolyticum TaxID=43595 RepID=A0A4R7YYW3_9FIRM|nr:GGDEF domain-containing phosphodiesterase [Halanaerobium saccharolyticum]RAK08974.1 diguanylate cyclase (GGDEF)-like protein [Halanaerobium saccharolyticum]TDW02632.1 diguanylate cyclase (GGDEF)-like protein [Halanaerobium saccharolyticum]TDX60737.1 diguanylate cyclase (GGDEF)-like protein [Halanaerobium saccharolyticum]